MNRSGGQELNGDYGGYSGSSSMYYSSRTVYNSSNYMDHERGRDRSMRSDRDWHKAVDQFIDERRLMRERSPQRDRLGRDWDYKNKRRNSRDREFRRDYNRDSPKDDMGSNSSDDGREYQRHRDRYRDDEEKPRGKYRESFREDKKDDYSKWNEDGYDSSETRDSGEYDNQRYRYDSRDRVSSYKEQEPNRTIIIRGLAQHITESDIWQDTLKCNLAPRDIRLIRRKRTGTSRGFAFVEFVNTTDAVQWMEMKQGELMLKDHYRAVMHYSLQKTDLEKDKWTTDWHCKCTAHNFRRRYFCYKCGRTRQDGELVEGNEDICQHPTYVVLLRGLDTLTTEENVLKSIQSVSSLPIRSVEIGRDPVTNTSRGVCYIKMNNVVDAVFLHNALLMAKPVIDEKEVIVSYCKLDPANNSNSNSSGSAAPSSLGTAAIAAAHWSHQKTSTSNQYTLEDVKRLAEYSANLYATNPQEKASYLIYYQQYYETEISKGNQISLPSTATIYSAPALADKSETEQKNTKVPLTEPPNGSGKETYPVPDVSTYQYDKSSGYFYDPYTTLYYDANSQYYYNQKTQSFLYWDSSKNTYLPAPTSTNTATSAVAAAAAEIQPNKEEELKKNKEKEKQTEKDKVKVAKKIAKDMEKWAKTLNQKKESARQTMMVTAASLPATKPQGSADIGFAVLERKDLSSIPIANIASINDDSLSVANDISGLVAAYGQGSDSEEDPDDGSGLLDDKQFTDWSKLACLLCKRQFPSKDVLVKHQQMSDLHKQNLESWYKSRGLDLAAAQKKSQQYRDRAKERRLKYGEPDQPQPNRLKETYMKAREATVTYEEPTKMGLGSDNLGNKLLQKMGWHEGMGLGKKNQGRTSIIETERRSATAGLGSKSRGVVPGPGETYKDCVKKMMKIRYQEIDERT